MCLPAGFNANRSFNRSFERNFNLNLNFNLEDHSMDISLVSAASNSGGDPVPTMMLRKSLDLQAQSVATLLGSMPQVSVPASNPPHLGQSIDVKV
ncbi:YjfB family protein [Cupriavidus basilensis]|uniref:YjfB family protein n=1 Tax=Cupriavidus basilensis TaxID=68895 RepID=UPI0034648F53